MQSYNSNSQIKVILPKRSTLLLPPIQMGFVGLI